MTFIIAGVILVLALAVGALSYMVMPRLIEHSQENDQEDQLNSSHCPVVSPRAFFAKGKWRRWIVVSGAALLCAAAAYRSAYADVHILELCRQTAVGLLLLSAMIIDAKTHRIPNVLVLCGLGAGAVLLPFEFWLRRESFVSTLLMSVGGLLLCGLLLYILSRLTKEGIGMGDVQLIAVMGWLLGMVRTLSALLPAMLLCSIVAVVLLVVKKKSKSDTIPMGPFLFFGYIAMWLLLV